MTMRVGDRVRLVGAATSAAKYRVGRVVEIVSEKGVYVVWPALPRCYELVRDLVRVDDEITQRMPIRSTIRGIAPPTVGTPRPLPAGELGRYSIVEPRRKP